MVSKENIKHYILLSIVIILLYKFINNPIQFISGIRQAFKTKGDNS